MTKKGMEKVLGRLEHTEKKSWPSSYGESDETTLIRKLVHSISEHQIIRGTYPIMGVDSFTFRLSKPIECISEKFGPFSDEGWWSRNIEYGWVGFGKTKRESLLTLFQNFYEDWVEYVVFFHAGSHRSEKTSRKHKIMEELVQFTEVNGLEYAKHPQEIKRVVMKSLQPKEK